MNFQSIERNFSLCDNIARVKGSFFLDLQRLKGYISKSKAGIAQLVERNLAKVDVAGSSPVSRSQ